MNGQRYVIKLDGLPHNKDKLLSKPNAGEYIPPTRVSTTNISVTHKLTTPQLLSSSYGVKGGEQQQQQEQQQQLLSRQPLSQSLIIKKRETISGDHTTHFQKSTHRVEHVDRQRTHHHHHQSENKNNKSNMENNENNHRKLRDDSHSNNNPKPTQQLPYKPLQKPSSSTPTFTLSTNNNYDKYHNNNGSNSNSSSNSSNNNNNRQLLYRERMSKNSSQLDFNRQQRLERVGNSVRNDNTNNGSNNGNNISNNNGNNGLNERRQERSAITMKSKKNKLRSEEEADAYSDDDEFDEQKADKQLLRTVKRALLDYITEKPSRKLKSGELTWTEIKPYVFNIHYPQFRRYLRERNIDAPNKMIFRCIKDLHISRRDGWLKKRRRERERRSKDLMDNLEMENTNSDGYITYYRRNGDDDY